MSKTPAMLMTQGTTVLSQTQESLQLPVTNQLNQHKANAPLKKGDLHQISLPAPYQDSTMMRR